MTQKESHRSYYMHKKLAKFSSESKPTVFLVGDEYRFVEKDFGLSFPSLPRVVREGENSTEATLG